MNTLAPTPYTPILIVSPATGRFLEQWVPGAFEDQDVEAVKRFHVLQETWDVSGDLPLRTILKTRPIEFDDLAHELGPYWP